jgi:hypothetical protein
MTDPLDQIARICQEQPECSLTEIADVLGFTEERDARLRAAVLGQVWGALDKAYADSDPQGPTRKGIGIAAGIVAQMQRALASGVRTPDGEQR